VQLDSVNAAGGQTLSNSPSYTEKRQRLLNAGINHQMVQMMIDNQKNQDSTNSPGSKSPTHLRGDRNSPGDLSLKAPLLPFESARSELSMNLIDEHNIKIIPDFRD